MTGRITWLLARCLAGPRCAPAVMAVLDQPGPALTPSGDFDEHDPPSSRASRRGDSARGSSVSEELAERRVVLPRHELLPEEFVRTRGRRRALLMSHLISRSGAQERVFPSAPIAPIYNSFRWLRLADRAAVSRTHVTVRAVDDKSDSRGW